MPAPYVYEPTADDLRVIAYVRPAFKMGKTAVRYENYKEGEMVADYIRKNLAKGLAASATLPRADVRWDAKRDAIKFADPEGAAEAAARVEAASEEVEAFPS